MQVPVKKLVELLQVLKAAAEKAAAEAAVAAAAVLQGSLDQAEVEMQNLNHCEKPY